MKKIFWLSIAVACLAGCSLFTVPNVKPVVQIVKPGEGLTTDNHVVSIAEIESAIKADEAQLAQDKAQLAKDKAELKAAKTLKVQHEIMISAGIFVLLALGCLAVVIWTPFKVQGLKALGGCVAGLALACLAVKLAPYRTWIEVGIAVATGCAVALYVVRHQHKTLSALATLEKKI